MRRIFTFWFGCFYIAAMILIFSEGTETKQTVPSVHKEWTYMRTGNVKLSDYGIDVLKLGKAQSQMELVTAGRGANDVVINDFYPVEIEGELGVIVPSYETTITDSERLMLARLTFAEAGNQDLYGQRLVVDVVLNRRDKSEWPNTIEGVIFQKSQFSTIDDGAYARTVGEDLSSCYKAIEKELYGRLDYNIIYFNSGEYCMNGVGGWKYKDHWFAY